MFSVLTSSLSVFLEHRFRAAPGFRWIPSRVEVSRKARDALHRGRLPAAPEENCLVTRAGVGHAATVVPSRVDAGVGPVVVVCARCRCRLVPRLQAHPERLCQAKSALATVGCPCRCSWG